MMLAVVFHISPFNVEVFSFYSLFIELFYRENVLDMKCFFSISVEMLMWFISLHSVHVVLQKLIFIFWTIFASQECIPLDHDAHNPLICCWVYFATNFWGVLHLTFYKLYGSLVLFLLVLFSDFGIREMLAL